MNSKKTAGRVATFQKRVNVSLSLNPSTAPPAGMTRILRGTDRSGDVRGTA